MFFSRVAATLRYLASIGFGFVVIGLSVMFLFEAPASMRDKSQPTMATLKPMASPDSLPALKATAFDIARAVPVVVTGKVDAKTIAAPVHATAAPLKTDPSTTAAPAAGQAMVVADAANVRSGPSKGSTKLFVVRSGQMVDVLERDGSWSRIVGPGGASGWVATKFLRQ